jgi:putative sigma-54 modulation protein
MRKYKDRVVDRRSGHRAPTVVKTAPGIDEIRLPEPVEAAVARTKVIDAVAMSEEDAILQLELLGHDFFVYRSLETDAINVLYRRTEGDFGVIRPSS